MSAPVVLKYRAFLSYAHADVRWGKSLHGQLEGFRIDRDLAGRATAMGPVPPTLRPIFRDREDFTGGHTLTGATIAALDQSAALIVLCSTVAATRPAVNEEVRLFRRRHPDRPVIPVIIDGTYPDNFPPALRFEIAADGTITDHPVTILGPDLREAGDGKTLGLAKVVAGLIGVGTDEIVRRAEREARRRMRNWVAGLSVVAVSLAGLAVWAEVNRREAVEQRLIAEERRKEAEHNFALAKGAADGLVFDIAQGLRDVEGMRASTVEKILGTARGTFDKLADAAPNNLELQRSRSVMLNEFGDTYRDQGNLPAALDAFKASLAIAERLAKADPGNAGWQRDLSVSHDRIGDVLRAQGNLPAALDAFKASLAIRDRLAKADPGNAGWQRDLALSYGRVASLQAKQGARDEARAGYQRAKDIILKLKAQSPDNATLPKDLAFYEARLAEL